MCIWTRPAFNELNTMVKKGTSSVLNMSLSCFVVCRLRNLRHFDEFHDCFANSRQGRVRQLEIML